MVEILYFYQGSEWQSEDDIENTRWLELLRQFTAVKDLYLLRISTQSIVPTLEALIGGGITDVLPAVQSILLEKHCGIGTCPGDIGRFVAERQLSGPTIVSVWEVAFLNLLKVPGR